MGASDTNLEVWREQMRLIGVVRKPNPDEDFLTQLLDGESPTVESVRDLLIFARQRWGYELSGHEKGELILPKIQDVCIDYLTRAKAPIPPLPTYSGSSVLDEMEEDERRMEARLDAFCQRAYGRGYSFPRDSETLTRYCKDENFRKFVDSVDGDKL